jgi:hypothetical protein
VVAPARFTTASICSITAGSSSPVAGFQNTSSGLFG